MKLLLSTILLSFGAILFAQTATNTTDANGLKQGYWVKLNPETGRPAYKGTFKDGKPDGLFKYYYPEVDTMHSIMDFRNGGKVGYSSMFYMTGVIQAKGKYVDEKKDSTWNFYDEGGKILSVENYSAGKRNGKSTIYFLNGLVSEEKSYKMDQLDGLYKEYYESKKVRRERNYVNGKQVGKEVVYFPNGVVELIGVYNKAGKMHGVWITSDKTGKQLIKAVYDNGKRLSGKKAEEWLEKNKGKSTQEPKEKPKTTTKPTTNKDTKPTGKSGTKK
ncbi:MAG: toxin-antitoxin system YwqK family antitoxin [Bacteroidota bacterium]|nr:toxin-antitoxin system YwqK family antitoxin [Bacteroidota bacterium]